MFEPAAHCTICLTDFSLEDERQKENFAIFPCGHGFCRADIARLFHNATRPHCPHCRIALHRRDAHPIHIEIVDGKASQVATIIDGLEQMGADTPSVSISKASKKMEKVLGNPGVDEGVLAALLKAVENFKERINPIFAKVESQKEEMSVMRDDLRRLRRERDGLNSKLEKAKPLQNEVVRLRTALSETERNTDEALRLAEVAKDELAAHHTSTTQWKKRVAELDQENKRYKDQLERLKNNERLQKEKNRKLSKQVADLTQRLADEKDAMSDVTHDYDGDFSAHEHSRIHLESSFRVVTATPSNGHRYPLNDENKPELSNEGMPPPNFPSDWHLSPGVLKKRNVNGILVSGHRRVANPISKALSLDKKGHPTTAVQLGPKALIRIGR